MQLFSEVFCVFFHQMSRKVMKYSETTEMRPMIIRKYVVLVLGGWSLIRCWPVFIVLLIFGHVFLSGWQ